MEHASTAHLKNFGVSPYKCRLLANQIRGLSVEKALITLKFSPKEASHAFLKLLESAISNAEQKGVIDIDSLEVVKVCVDPAPTLKRIRARAKGRANRILKRRSHISLALTENRGN